MWTATARWRGLPVGYVACPRDGTIRLGEAGDVDLVLPGLGARAELVRAGALCEVSGLEPLCSGDDGAQGGRWRVRAHPELIVELCLEERPIVEAARFRARLPPWQDVLAAAVVTALMPMATLSLAVLSPLAAGASDPRQGARGGPSPWGVLSPTVEFLGDPNRTDLDRVAAQVGPDRWEGGEEGDDPRRGASRDMNDATFAFAGGLEVGSAQRPEGTEETPGPEARLGRPGPGGRWGGERDLLRARAKATGPAPGDLRGAGDPWAGGGGVGVGRGWAMTPPRPAWSAEHHVREDMALDGARVPTWAQGRVNPGGSMGDPVMRVVSQSDWCAYMVRLARPRAVDVVFVVDVSAGMDRAHPEIERQIREVGVAARRWGAEVRFGLVTFADEVHLDPGTARSAAYVAGRLRRARRARGDGAPAGGPVRTERTAVALDALVKATREYPWRIGLRTSRVVVWLTDMAAGRSKGRGRVAMAESDRYDEVARVLRDRDIQMLTFGGQIVPVGWDTAAKGEISSSPLGEGFSLAVGSSGLSMDLGALTSRAVTIAEATWAVGVATQGRICLASAPAEGLQGSLVAEEPGVGHPDAAAQAPAAGE